MANTQAKGRTVRIQQPASQIFAIFSDLTNFTKSLPEDIGKKANIVSTCDTLSGNVQGFDLGIKVAERIPFSLIRYEQYGRGPFPFNFIMRIESISQMESSFNLELNAELSGMFKMMLGGKLQEAVDKITDELEKGMGGSPLA